MVLRYIEFVCMNVLRCHFWAYGENFRSYFKHSNPHSKTANMNKKTTGRICHIPFSWEARWIFSLFRLSSTPRLIWFLITFVCISNEGASPLYLLTCDDAHTGSFFCFKYLQLFILANSCRQLLSGQHSQRNIMSGIRLHDHWLWEAVNDYALETEKITACV